MTYTQAQQLIAEARKLGYKGTEWERNLITRLEMFQPAILTEQDAKSLTVLYQRAAGGSNFVRREVIGSRRRYHGGD